MARHFTDFLSAYFEYARDNFAPDRFHQWVGRSIVAAAIERKITLKQGRIHHVPNIYVMLVSHPAVGKSTAMEAGTDLIEQVRAEFNPNLRIIPNQTTEPAFIDLMKIIDHYPVSPTLTLPQSAGYFYASEASASALQNTCGDFVASLTAFYDCPRWFRKKLKGEADPTEIENGCMNLLAGSTFDYLRTLVNEQSVLGGFASRLIYVVEEERKVRRSKWGESKPLDSQTARKLVEDLAEINKLVGPMKPTADFITEWEAFQPEFDQFLIDLKNSRLEAIMSRKGTNLLKLSMILSVSEGNSLIVTGEHFRRAREIVEDAYKDNREIISQALIADKESSLGAQELALKVLRKGGGVMSMKAFKTMISQNGNAPDSLEKTIDFMVRMDILSYDASSGLVRMGKMLSETSAVPSGLAST